MLKTIIKIFLFCSGVYAQSYFYSYVDPCSQLSVANSYKVSQDGEDGFRVTFYNRTKFFTFEQVLNGELEAWAQSVYRDFEDLFPCAVKVAEEILSSLLASNISEQFGKSDDISVEPTQVNYAIRTTTRSDTIQWVTSYNSVYTNESFDGNSQYDGNFNFTDDFKKASLTFGQSFKLLNKSQNKLYNGTWLIYQTFEGWDWLVSSSYSKALTKTPSEAFVLTGTYGNVGGFDFANLTSVYGIRFPIEFMNYEITFSNYVAYVLLRYYEGLPEDNRYLFLRSPFIMFPTVSFDWKFGKAFTFNIGLSMGYNTVVNDYGIRNKTYSVMIGSYF